MTTGQWRWYGVKALVEHKRLTGDPDSHVYEERIVVLRAAGFDEAIARAEKEVEQYAAGIDGGVYLGYCNAYALDEDARTIEDGTEVFSLTREVKLGPQEFITRYYDDGTDKHH